MHDAAGIAEIFNEVLEERAATFETRPATPENVERWIAEDIVVVAERGSALVGWAKAGPYTDRHYYDGVREATLYVAREARRIGVGHALLERLAVEAAGQGAHKLVGKVFSSNDGEHRAARRPRLARGGRASSARRARRRMEGRAGGRETARDARLDRSFAGIEVL